MAENNCFRIFKNGFMLQFSFNFVKLTPMADNDSAQEDELLALGSIFDEGIVTIDQTAKEKNSLRSGCLTISPDIPNLPMKLICKYLKQSPETISDNSENHITETVSYLPPICLRFILPQNYPSSGPPQYTLTSIWLDRLRLSLIANKLDSVWEEHQGQEILYTWVQFIKEDVLEFLNLDSEVSIRQADFIENSSAENLDQRVMQDIGRFSDILPAIQDYDNARQKEVFENTPFPCDICFSEKYGKNCVKFKGCGHIYCDSCLKSYFDVHIKDGNMKSLVCPEPGCEFQALPFQIKNLVSEEDFERYESILLQTTLDTMSDVMYCPRKFCQSPVLIEEDETMGMCAVCHYSFCTYCKLAYHGVEPCKLKLKKLTEICEQYQNGDDSIRKELEGKYGAKVLRETIENIESERWMAANSKPCPDCGAAIEKQSGCNKMTCYKCKCYFCWLCVHRLSKANPYTHFNTFNSKCYNKLFDGVDVDEEFMDVMYW